MERASDSPLARHISSAIGADRVRDALPHEASVAELIVEPASDGEVAEIVRMAERDAFVIAPLAGARSLSLMRPQAAALGISMARMNRLVDYEPDDMTAIAQSGMMLDELAGALSSKNQRLADDPAKPSTVTVGSLIAGAKSGPFRHSAGTVRDLLIGIAFVGHGGRIVHGGGRVVKNVAGYDLMKVMTGSFGTLGIITEATFKVHPAPEHYALAIAAFGDASEAFAASRDINEALPLLHLEVLSPVLSAELDRSGEFLLLAGLAGNQEELSYQRDRIRQTVRDSVTVLEGAEAEQSYARLRDLDQSSAPIAATIAVLPAELERVLARCGADFCARAGCGVAQISRQSADAENAQRIVAGWRQAAHSARGHVRITSLGPELRAAAPIFDQPNEGELRLMRRLKTAFDPSGIFNTGGFVGGI